MKLKHLLDYYIKAPIRFNDIFQTTLEYGYIDKNRKTSANLCGIIIPLEGEAEFRLNGKKYMINKQIFLHAGSQMTINFKALGEQSFTYMVLHYAVSDVNRYPLANEHFAFTLNQSEQLLATAELLKKQAAYPDDFSKLRCQTIFIQFIEQLLIHLREGQDGENSLVKRIVSYIHKYYQEGISVAEIQKEFSIDARKLPQLFQQYTGLTPLQYIIELRLRDAKNLLRNTNLSIGNIGEEVGYNDAFYFSRIFKKNIGISPKEYRKTMQGN